MILACSHLVVATSDVPRITAFFAEAFGVAAHFENEMFSEFVLASKFRVAFFKPVGRSAAFFSAGGERGAAAIGLTVADVDGVYRKLVSIAERVDIRLSGPPKEHPWGERSFLMVDVDGNRWEITESPAGDGMLVEKEQGAGG